MIKSLDDWEPLEVDDVLSEIDENWKDVKVKIGTKMGVAICRKFKYPNYILTFGFVSKIVLKAQALDHHPDIEFGYNWVNVTLCTHKTGGLTRIDLKFARWIDFAYDWENQGGGLSNYAEIERDMLQDN